MCAMCGRDGYRIGHICSMKDDAIVCEECCSNCTFRRGYHCGHRSENLQIEEEIKKLKTQIEFLEKKAFNAYNRGWVRTADNYIWEAKELRRQKRALEEKRNEHGRDNSKSEVHR